MNLYLEYQNVTSFEMPPFKDVEEKKENDLEDTITISRDSINEEKNRLLQILLN